MTGKIIFSILAIIVIFISLIFFTSQTGMIYIITVEDKYECVVYKHRDLECFEK